MQQLCLSCLGQLKAPKVAHVFGTNLGLKTKGITEKVASTDLARMDVEFISPNALQQHGRQTPERRPSIYCPRAEQVRSRHDGRFS